MIMMKRILSLALALALGTTLLSGCSKGDGSEDSSASGSSADTSTPSEVEPMDLTGVTDPLSGHRRHPRRHRSGQGGGL